MKIKSPRNAFFVFWWGISSVKYIFYLKYVNQTNPSTRNNLYAICGFLLFFEIN